MHSFDNSQAADRKKNNWELLGKFLQKNDLPIHTEDYIKIQDNDLESLRNFMIKMYTLLTNRK
jgi:hypothetical protein